MGGVSFDAQIVTVRVYDARSGRPASLRGPASVADRIVRGGLNGNAA
jgi:hypothetical protein